MQLNSIANPASPLHPNNQRAYQVQQQKCDKCGQVVPSRNNELIAVVIFFSILFAFCFFAFVVIFDALRDTAPRR